MIKNKYNVGVFGATGEVGREIINVLYNLKVPVKNLSLFASKRSEGIDLETPYGTINVQNGDKANYSNLGISFWAVSGDWSKNNLERSQDSDCYVIDNSSAFRYDSKIPLIVPEINGSVLEDNPSKLIANPNCTTAIAAIPLHILNEMYGIKKVILSTYQSASGAGNGGIKELLQQTKSHLSGLEVKANIFSHPLAFNLIPHIDQFQQNGYTKEEMKTDWELKKILGLKDDIRISSTCVRVPVLRSHAESVVVETRNPVNIEEYSTALRNEEMITLRDDPKSLQYPMPINTSNQYPIEVGRIRHPEVFDNGVSMFLCGDQLLRGAALNAVLIGQKLIELDKLN